MRGRVFTHAFGSACARITLSGLNIFLGMCATFRPFVSKEDIFVVAVFILICP